MLVKLSRHPLPPLILHRNPLSKNRATFLYFASFLLVAYYFMMNLLLAAIYSDYDRFMKAKRERVEQNQKANLEGEAERGAMRVGERDTPSYCWLTPPPAPPPRRGVRPPRRQRRARDLQGHRVVSL